MLLPWIEIKVKQIIFRDIFLAWCDIISFVPSSSHVNSFTSKKHKPLTLTIHVSEFEIKTVASNSRNTTLNTTNYVKDFLAILR